VYGIRPKTVRQPKTPLEPHGSTPKGYEVADFSDAFARYLKPERAQPVAGHPPEATATVVARAEEVADTPQRTAPFDQLEQKRLT
jgi:hypothetical protein